MNLCHLHPPHSEGSDLLPQHSGFPIDICRWSKIYISFTLSAIPSHAIQVWSLREFVRITPSVVEAFQVITHWANRGSWLSYFFIHLEKKSFRFPLAEMLPLSCTRCICPLYSQAILAPCTHPLYSQAILAPCTHPLYSQANWPPVLNLSTHKLYWPPVLIFVLTSYTGPLYSPSVLTSYTGPLYSPSVLTS